jgi:hypothetical protein
LPDGTADVVDVGALATVPVAPGSGVVGGSRMSVYFVPSAVFCSVRAVPIFSVIACAPSAYEPPTIAIFAVLAVSETTWKSEPARRNVAPAVGKSPPTVTPITSPLSEMIALVGAGVEGDDGDEGEDGEDGEDGVTAGLVDVPPPPEPFGAEPLLTGAPSEVAWAAKGSFDANLWNASSCPGSAETGTAPTRFDVPAATGAAAGVPPSVGAASEFGSLGVTVGVAAGVGADGAVSGGSGFGFSIFRVFGPWIARSATSRMPPPIAIFFCFAALAFASSCFDFLAMAYGAPVADGPLDGVSVVVVAVVSVVEVVSVLAGTGAVGAGVAAAAPA